MALIRLGQTSNALAEQTLFTCDAAIHSFVIARSLIVTNRSAFQVTFRVAHVTGSGATGNADYWFYDTILVPNQGLLFPLDCGLSPGDVVRVLSNSNAVTFNLYGEGK